MFFSGRNRLQSIGVRLREMNPDIIVIADKVIANSLNILPNNPLHRESMGRKTAIRERVMETIVKLICRDPSIEALKRSSPPSCLPHDIFQNDNGIINNESHR